MIRKGWPIVVVLVVACAAALLLVHSRSRQAPAAGAAPAPAAAATTAPPGPPAAKSAPARQPSGYDHYRAEMKRNRAELDKAGALEANERCIGRQRFRKVGTAWERAGNC